MKKERGRVEFRLPLDLIRRVRVEAAGSDREMSEVLEEILRDRYGRADTAKREPAAVAG